MTNPVELGTAMNRMYEGILSALNRHTADTNVKFSEISRDITAIKETNSRMSDKLVQAVEQIEALRLSKADSGALQLVASESKSFKVEMVKRVGEQDDKIANLETRIQGMSKAKENNRCGTAIVRNELRWRRDILKLENDLTEQK